MKSIYKALLLLITTSPVACAMEEAQFHNKNATGKRPREIPLMLREKGDHDTTPSPNKKQQTTGNFAHPIIPEDSVTENQIISLKEQKERFRRYWVENPQDLAKVDKWGNTVFHNAARKGGIEAIKFFCETYPYFIEKVNINGDTALHVAVSYDKLAVVQYLCENHSQLLFKLNNKENSVLQLAILKDNIEIVHYLCESHPQLVTDIDSHGNTALHFAASQGKPEVVQYLCEKHPDLLTRVDSCGRSPLHAAAEHGKLEVLQYLNKKDPQLLMQVDSYGNTLLHAAASHGTLEVVQYLCEKHPELLTHVGSNKYSPLHVAASHGKLDVVQYLCEKHSEFLMQIDSYNNTPLHFAASHGKIEVVQYLCEKHPELLMQIDSYNNTPLHFAASHGKLEVVQYLCEKHPELLTEFNFNGHTPLHAAAAQGKFEVVQYICICFPMLISVQTQAGLDCKSIVPAHENLVIDILEKSEQIYFLGLIPDSMVKTSKLHLDDFNQLDLPLMSEILRHQPLNYHGGHKIIAAVKTAVDEANSKFDERMHHDYYDYMLKLLENDPSQLLKGSQEELLAIFKNEKQEEQAVHEQSISRGMELIKLFQQYRVPNLRSLVLHSLTPKLLHYGKYGQTQNEFADNNDYFTVLFDLIKLSAEDHLLAWQEIVPGIRLNTQNLKDYLQVIRSRRN